MSIKEKNKIDEYMLKKEQELKSRNDDLIFAFLDILCIEDGRQESVGILIPKAEYIKLSNLRIATYGIPTLNSWDEIIKYNYPCGRVIDLTQLISE